MAPLDFIKRKIVWRILFAVAAVQALFWFGYYPLVVQRPVMPPPVGMVRDISEGGLDRPEYAALARAKMRPVADLPMEVCCQTGYRALRFTLDLPRVPERGLVMVPGFGADNHFLYVNGQFADGRGRLTLPDVTYHHNDFRMIRISPGALRAGANEFVAILVRDTGTGFDYLPPAIFDAADFKAPHERREFVIGTFGWMQLAASLLVALLAALLLVRSRDRAEPFWLFLVAACWALQLLFYKWTDPPFGGAFRLGYSFSIYVMIAYGCFGWANAWSPRPLRWALPAATAFFLFALGAVWGAVYFLPADRGNLFSAIGGLVLSVAAVARLLWGVTRIDEKRVWELAFALPLPVGLAADMYGELTRQARMGIAELSQPILITGLLAAFVARNIRLFRSQEQISGLLQQELTARTADLNAAHAREKALISHQAHESERRRIMRDMHDGLGSQLLAMLLAARRGALKPEAMAEGLQSVIDEMRLMIESMDSVGQSLTSALALFRQRVEPRVQEAGMALEWSDTLGAAAPRYGPREALQVFRILQEAVANALKHAQAKMLAVSIGPGPDAAYPVRIRLADDGRGMTAERGAGRGLDNMARRAAALGALLDIRSRGPGVEVVLDLPAREAGLP